MIKIVKNPNLSWMGKTELNGKKYIFVCDDFSSPAYAKIGLIPLFGYVGMKLKYRNK